MCYNGYDNTTSTANHDKALIAYETKDTPPKIHNLSRLASLANIFDDLSESQLELLKDLTPLQIEARYPEYKAAMQQFLTREKCQSILKETEDFLCWIKKRLEKLQGNLQPE